jgi:DNA (cytosine-5)-methyltransferase 1
MKTGYFRYTLDELKQSSDRKLFSVISFFAGGGGSSCGYKLAGGEIKFVNEFQQVAVDTYLKNWPGTANICDDIRNVDAEKIMNLTGLKVGEIDILDASPPCPPFSMSGSKKKGWNKEKMAYGMKQKNIEDLTWDVIRIAKDLQPKVIVCENVKGLTMDYAVSHLKKMIADFEAIGYEVTHKILRGHDHGVPQKRERIFIVCVRNDVCEKVGLNFMTMAHVFPDTHFDVSTVADAIRDIENDPANLVEAKIMEDAMRDSAKAKWVFGFKEHPDIPGSSSCAGLAGLNQELMDSRVISIGDDIVKPWFEKQVKDGIVKEVKNSYYQSRVVPYNQASHTLSEQGLQPRFMGGNHMHPNGKRTYTPTEAKRIMTLPEDYMITGTIDEQQARIGLMVAPIQMKVVAENIYEKVIKVYNENS